MARIRTLTKNGAELAMFFYRIFSGEEIDGVKPKLEDRMRAGDWLAVHGFGRPVPMEIEAAPSRPNVTFVLAPSRQVVAGPPVLPEAPDEAPLRDGDLGTPGRRGLPAGPSGA